ncbi:pyridoxal phosphate-dependent transferase [Xylogone sp. PMI_703]|nr:pyridoxal phosphate-dependent transferase [Xylogone sp. PMI_703]
MALPINESALLHSSLLDPPHTVVKASGHYLTLEDGREILDGCGGAAVAAIGHCNPGIIQAIKAQLACVDYVHAVPYTTKASEDLAEIILENAPTQCGLEKVFFVCSGSEANDSAMKLARQYYVEQGQTERKYFISRRQAYHGNTIGSMSISSNVGRKEIYDGAITLPYVSHVSPAYAYRYLDPMESEEQYSNRLISEIENEILNVGPENVIAFVAETVVGSTAGCVFAPRGYFSAARKLCDKYGVLLILDEIMCGAGRTGTFFAFEQENVVPDIVTIGKSLGSGYAPISAVVVHRKVVDVLRNGTSTFNHGHTYQQHPVSCAAALAVQKMIQERHLVQRCQEIGQTLGLLLSDALSECKYVGDIRGRGLFWAVEFVSNKIDKSPFDPSIGFGIGVQQIAFRHGVALYPSSRTVDGVQGDHILIAPPYTIEKVELQIIVSVLKLAYILQEEDIDRMRNA